MVGSIKLPPGEKNEIRRKSMVFGQSKSKILKAPPDMTKETSNGVC